MNDRPIRLPNTRCSAIHFSLSHSSKSSFQNSLQMIDCAMLDVKLNKTGQERSVEQALSVVTPFPNGYRILSSTSDDSSEYEHDHDFVTTAAKTRTYRSFQTPASKPKTIVPFMNPQRHDFAAQGISHTKPHHPRYSSPRNAHYLPHRRPSFPFASPLPPLSFHFPALASPTNPLINET
jgi:hypothetical protein